MSQQLSREVLQNILQNQDIEQLSISRLTKLFRSEDDIAKYVPDGTCQIDPRNGERILYNSARARRPHDNRPDDTSEENDGAEEYCLICQGKTTGVLDVANLSEGFTFINKNLFPVLFPLVTPDSDKSVSSEIDDDTSPGGISTRGFHFLQWTSSLHDKDWHNLAQTDRVVVMKRLASLEKKLLLGTAAETAISPPWGDYEHRYGFVSIIKNHGYLVGGSLEHGHQQIGFSNVMPRRFRDNWRFEMDQGETFASFMLHQNPADLVVKDYGPALLLVPYFMRRPFDMMLILKDTRKRYMYELTDNEIMAVADGWHDALRFILWMMPRMGRETAYTVVTNNGPGAGLYFEFLPYTQEIGGFEQLGLCICQGNPPETATQIREFLEEDS